jgi:predicted heme/steroid binding protein
MSKTLTQDEVAKHNSEKNGVWIVVDNNVYDMSSLYVALLLWPLNHMLIPFFQSR